MLGLYGIYTPIGPEVGVNRSMVLNPKIETTRGFITDFDVDASDATNLFSIGELLNVFTPKHADAPRAVMATVQGKHLTPTKVQHPYMIGNGTDRLLPHLIGQEYAFKSVDDGVIEQIHKATNLCVIKYKDGQRSIINLDGLVAKNSGGGFYTENRLQLMDGLKVGSKVKKGQVVAIDHNFFKETVDGSVGFAGGYLAKIAVAALPETFEDSGIFTNDLVDGLSSDVMNERPAILNKNTRLIKMAQIGDHVEVNDSLVVFEDVGNDEELALKALERLDAATSKDIEEEARQKIKAKYAGEIFDIKIYYNRNLEDLHPTLQKLINDYTRKYKAKAKLIETGRDDEIVSQPSTEKVESDKILGTDVDGVMIQFFIRHNDTFKVGDKACFAIALKTICAETVEKGKEPYSSYRKKENVQAIISPLSLVSRMVPDLYLIGYCNKCLIELQRQVIDILEE